MFVVGDIVYIGALRYVVIRTTFSVRLLFEIDNIVVRFRFKSTVVKLQLSVVTKKS